MSKLFLEYIRGTNTSGCLLSLVVDTARLVFPVNEVNPAVCFPSLDCINTPNTATILPEFQKLFTRCNSGIAYQMAVGKQEVITGGRVNAMLAMEAMLTVIKNTGRVVQSVPSITWLDFTDNSDILSKSWMGIAIPFCKITASNGHLICRKCSITITDTDVRISIGGRDNTECVRMLMRACDGNKLYSFF